MHSHRSLSRYCQQLSIYGILFHEICLSTLLIKTIYKLVHAVNCVNDAINWNPQFLSIEISQPFFLLFEIYAGVNDSAVRAHYFSLQLLQPLTVCVLPFATNLALDPLKTWCQEILYFTSSVLDFNWEFGVGAILKAKINQLKVLLLRYSLLKEQHRDYCCSWGYNKSSGRDGVVKIIFLY